MNSDDPININLLDPALGDMPSTFCLKVIGVSARNLQNIADHMNLLRISSDDEAIQSFETHFREFGTAKKQAIQLLAAALVIYHHFPKVKMALHGQFALEPLAPLHLSAAARLYFSQAGFELPMAHQDHVLGPQEMESLEKQFRSMALSLQNRSA
jgi:hypothetical protein